MKRIALIVLAALCWGCGGVSGSLEGRWVPAKNAPMYGYETYIFFPHDSVVRCLGGSKPGTIQAGRYRLEKGLIEFSLDGERHHRAPEKFPWERKGKTFVLNRHSPMEFQKVEPGDPLMGIYKRAGDPETEDEVGFIFAQGFEIIIGHSGLWDDGKPHRGLRGPWSGAQYTIVGSELEEKQDFGKRGRGGWLSGSRKRPFKLEGKTLTLGSLTLQKVDGPLPMSDKGFDKGAWEALR
jgi:hypothetical protein